MNAMTDLTLSYTQFLHRSPACPPLVKEGVGEFRMTEEGDLWIRLRN